MRRSKESGAIYFILGITLGLLLLFFSTHPQVSRLRSAAQTIATPFEYVATVAYQQVSGFFGLILTIHSLYIQNQQLETQVHRLEQEVVRLKEYGIENQILRKELGFVQQHKFSTVAARVIAQDPSGLVQTVLIDRGSVAGIKPGMVVVSDAGLAGKVISVSPDSSVVQLLTNVNSRVNAVLLPSRLNGTVVGNGSNLTMQIFPELGVQVSKGDYVVTSNIGGEYPPGLLIGRVSSYTYHDYQIMQQAIIQPATDFSRLDFLLVITNFLPKTP